MAGTILIRSPNAAEKRASFSLLRVTRQDGRRRIKTLDLPEVDLINERYRDGTLSFINANALIRDLRDRLLKQERGNVHKPVTLAENLALLESYWKRDYLFRDVVDRKTMRWDLERALRAIGNVPLLTADQATLQAKVVESKLRTNAKRRVISRLNQLLRFAGRPFKL